MKNEVPETTPYDVVAIYKKHGQKISLDEATQILAFIDNMVNRVKDRLEEKDGHYRFPDDPDKT